MIKQSIAVFFEGPTEFGLHCQYTALIPFHISEGVTIGGIQMEEKYCYNIFGRCALNIPVGGKVGAWMISFVK